MYFAGIFRTINERKCLKKLKLFARIVKKKKLGREVAPQNEPHSLSTPNLSPTTISLPGYRGLSGRKAAGEKHAQIVAAREARARAEQVARWERRSQPRRELPAY